MTSKTPARVYVGTYAKYNCGNLDGAWVNVEDFPDKEAFYEHCASLHKDEDDPELMFQDHEGIPRAFIGESWISEDLWRFFEIDDDKRPAFEAYLNHVGDAYAEEAFNTFEDNFRGYWKSEEDYAEDYADNCGYFSAMEKAGLEPRYFDIEALASDLFNGDFWRDNETGAVFSS